jgi:hypothetical protein
MFSSATFWRAAASLWGKLAHNARTANGFRAAGPAHGAQPNDRSTAFFQLA